jgi:hypothetical protein
MCQKSSIFGKHFFSKSEAVDHQFTTNVRKGNLLQKCIIWKVIKGTKNGPTQPLKCATSAQQPPSVRLRLGFGCATVSIISLLLATINHLFTNTYKTPVRTVDPMLRGSHTFGMREIRMPAVRRI